MNTSEMRVLTVTGVPRERGRVIGETLCHDVRAVVDKLELAIATGRGYSSRDYFAALDRYGDYVAAFECSPNRVAEYRPEANARRLVHTNHPLVNDDSGSYEKLAEVDPDCTWVRGEGNSRSRLASMSARTLDRETQVGLDELKSALRAKGDPDNPVCRDWSTDTGASVISFTAGSLVYELAEESQLHLAAGPSSQSEFLTFQFQGGTA